MPLAEGELTPDLLTELEQYRRLFNNIPAEIGVFDLEGRFLFNTPSGVRDPKVREWMLGKTTHEWCRERGHPMAIADKRQAAIERRPSRSRLAPCPLRGSAFWTSFSPILVDNREPLGLNYPRSNWHAISENQLSAYNTSSYVPERRNDISLTTKYHCGNNELSL